MPDEVFHAAFAALGKKTARDWNTDFGASPPLRNPQLVC